MEAHGPTLLAQDTDPASVLARPETFLDLDDDDDDDYSYEPSRPPPLPRPASYTSSPQSPDPNEFSFSFSEEDLIPSKTSWYSAGHNDYYDPVIEGQDYSDSSPTVYSKSSDLHPDPKITVQRTLLISEQQDREKEHLRKETTRQENARHESARQDNARHEHARQEKPRHEVSRHGNTRQEPQSQPAPQPKPQPQLPPSPKPQIPRPSSPLTALPPITGLPRSRGLSRTFASLSRRSKLSRADSHSPDKSDAKDAAKPSRPPSRSQPRPTELKEKRRSTQSPGENRDARQGGAPAAEVSRRTALLNRRAKPAPGIQTARLAGSDSNSQAPFPSRQNATPLLKSFSNTAIPTSAHSSRRSVEVPPLPGTVPSDRPRFQNAPPAVKRDELWSTFRSLDADHQKFQSKSIALKTNVIRSNLLPFLRTYAKHPSNSQLSAEDLDRRTAILNKWWSGLLEMLTGKASQNISGADRPIILDAINGIMERPEWRSPPSSFCPLAERHNVPDPELNNTNGADFLLESVHHNVRNTFVQNLFKQIVYVVEKMSLRNAAASLVNFCGKTCAYAFFFCPGISDILVRLWDVKPQDMHRILRASDIAKGTRLTETSQSIVAAFPHCLHDLAFTSVRNATKTLRQTPVLPLGIEKVQWHGHWLGRWSGRDSDLFYVFVKFYHSLAADFLPPSASREERICTPGLVLVHAQILSNLESTIHRQSTGSSNDPGAELSVTFDDLMSADGSASAMPAPPANAARVMNENRFVMLLRDVLAERDGEYPASCLIFAKSFCEILKAAAQTTSLYDTGACFTLCDFLQEALPVLVRFQSTLEPGDLPLHFSFWLEVFKKMVQSSNTTTEIRLYSFLFTAWASITSSDTWKMLLCLDFLLEEEHFTRTFSHWCPMVRAYYMRLLCWRVARYDGDATAEEVFILKTLMARLQGIWSYHKHLVDKAENQLILPPSTAPCNPAPGRKLLIIRTDAPVHSSMLPMNSMTALSRDLDEIDSKLPPDGIGEGLASAVPSFIERVTSSLEQTAGSKKGSLIRSLLGYGPEKRSRSQSPRPQGESSPQNDSPQGSRDASGRSSPDRGSSSSRLSMYESRPIPKALERSKSHGNKAANPAKTVPTRAFFKFSLEVVDRRPTNIPGPMVLEPPRVPLAAQLLLQSMQDFVEDVEPAEPEPSVAATTRYAGRALAEWTWVVNECQNFFERRRNEGVPTNRLVETPTLGVESFRRPG